MEITFFDCTDNGYAIESEIKGSDYDVDDCAMVRTTNKFPFEKIIQTPANGNDVILGESYIVNKSVSDLLKKIHPELFYDFGKSHELYSELANYRVLCKNYRSTIHFSLNGLVGNHAYGDFSNRKFIIIEPLRYHLKEKSLLSLGVDDTYFNDDIELSSEVAILMNEDTYREIYNKEEYRDTLRFMKIFIYKGDETIAVSKTLNSLGYDSFYVNSNGYVNGLDSNTGAYHMYNFIRELREKNNIRYIRHFNSVYNINDCEITNNNSVETDLEHFFYILDKAKDDGIIDDEIIEKAKYACEIDEKNKIDYTDLKYRMEKLSTCDSALLRIVPVLLESIGLDNIKKYTKEYNDDYLEKLNRKGTMHK